MGKTVSSTKMNRYCISKSLQEGFLLIETMVCLTMFCATVLIVGFAMAHMYSALHGYNTHTKAFDQLVFSSSYYLAHGTLPSRTLQDEFVITSQIQTVSHQPELVQSSHEVILEPLEFLKVSIAEKENKDAQQLQVYALAIKAENKA
jgi:hypothetical protein